MEPRISIITLGVADLARSLNFYRVGLELRTGEKHNSPEHGIIFFRTQFTVLALYPFEKLAEDVGPHFNVARSKFSGVTLAHNTRTKEEVNEIIKRAEQAGGKIEKQPHDTFWGGYSGYFSDPDGYLWEVACGMSLNEDGSVPIE